jgi:hypothetical protein
MGSLILRSRTLSAASSWQSYKINMQSKYLYGFLMLSKIPVEQGMA